MLVHKLRRNAVRFASQENCRRFLIGCLGGKWATVPTEAVNNLAKRIKRVAFGFANFRHHPVRCPFYAGGPDWTFLPAIQSLNMESLNTTRSPKPPRHCETVLRAPKKSLQQPDYFSFFEVITEF